MPDLFFQIAQIVRPRHYVLHRSRVQGRPKLMLKFIHQFFDLVKRN
jgi:hypothetical protein